MTLSNIEKKKFTVALTVIFGILLVFVLSSLELRDPEESLSPLDYKPKDGEETSTEDSSIVQFIDTHVKARNEKSTQENFVELVEHLGELDGQYSIYIKDINENKVYSHNENQVYYAASLYKVPVTIAVLKEIEIGTISLNTNIEYKEADFIDGTGIINTGKYGIEYRVEDLLDALLKHSDNTAQNMLLRLVGQAKVSSAIYAYIEDDQNSEFASENKSTASEYGTYLENIVKDGYISDESKDYLFDLMTKTAFDDRIANHLERNKSFAHKIGNWPEKTIWHDCGVVFSSEPIAIVCLMSQDTTFEEFLNAGKYTASFINKTF